MRAAASWTVLGAVAVAGMVALFTIPYYFPPAVMAVSGSFDYGFNNTVGILILGVLCFFYLVAGYFRAADASSSDVPAKPASKAVTRRDVLICAAIAAALIAILSLLASDYGFRDTESEQFLHGMQRLNDGQEIYRDFDFYYGPWLLYIPQLCFLLLEPFGGSMVAGYLLSLFLLQLLSLVQLRFLIDHLPITEPYRRITFYVAALATLPIHTGINLLLFRYISVPWAVLLISRMPPDQPTRRLVTAAASAVLIYGASPEYGIILSVVMLVIAAGSFLERRPLESAGIALLAVTTPLLFWLVWPGLFTSFGVYAQGGWRWPFVPSLGLTAFFAAMFLIAFAIGLRLRKARENVLYLTVCLAALGSVPAALGRCDPVHLMLNGCTILLLAFSYVSRSASRRVVAAYGGLMILAFGVLPTFSWLYMYNGVYMEQLAETISPDAPVEGVRRLAALAEPVAGRRLEGYFQRLERQVALRQQVLPELRPGEMFIAPMYLSDPLYRQLRSGGRLQPLYFKNFTIISTPEEAERMLAELRAHPGKSIIVPEGFLELDRTMSERSFINILFIANYTRPKVRNSRSIWTPVLDFMSENYVASERVGRYLILRPKNPGTAHQLGGGARGAMERRG